MKLVDQHVKKIMEECKKRAANEGLSFSSETLEYIVTNQDMIELSPKIMIPTMYDYWVYDVRMLQGKGEYEVYPNNPYETVINTRPVISFYNDNNPDWMNVAIFYHVIGHIDLFQNNIFFRNTWDDDFAGVALADKRLINRLRSEHGRWVDYIIEFSRAIDNLVGYFHTLSELNLPSSIKAPKKTDFFFDVYLQKYLKVPEYIYLKYIGYYNDHIKKNPDTLMGAKKAEEAFFKDVKNKYPDFEAFYEKEKDKGTPRYNNVYDFIIENSPFLKQGENNWMKQIMHVVRSTSMYFYPQIICKIFSEGWASYWHERLFLKDNRIKGHEADFARFHARVTAIPRVGLNPYATGLRLLYYAEDLAERGKLDYNFKKIHDIKERKKYHKKTNKGLEYLFKIREDLCDFSLINTFTDQDFVDRYKLFVAGRRINREKQAWEYYIKSKKAEDYKQMMIDSLYHPPNIKVDLKKTNEKELFLKHIFEGKGLVPEYIPNTMFAISYLWGGDVSFETTEIHLEQKNEDKENTYVYKPVLYTLKEDKSGDGKQLEKKEVKK